MQEPSSAELPLRSHNLVIVRAGRNSLHPTWLSTEVAPDFDVLITAYDQRAPSLDHPNVANVSLPGSKVAGYFDTFERFPQMFEHYQYIALIDDDIATSTESLNRLFEIGAEHRLDLWQPSLDWRSYLSYVILLQQPQFKLRYSNFIEMMCPFFRTPLLKEARPLFGQGWETGIDMVWTRLTEAPLFKAAIIDEVKVLHTRPVGSTKEQNGFAAGERYDAQMSKVLQHFNTAFHGPVAYAALDRHDNLIRNRLRLALAAAGGLRAYTQTPMPKKAFVKLALAAVRHTATRPINLDRLDPPPARPRRRLAVAGQGPH